MSLANPGAVAEALAQVAEGPYHLVALIRGGGDPEDLKPLDGPGGRARVHRAEGFTFDMGPTVITVPPSWRTSSPRGPATPVSTLTSPKRRGLRLRSGT